MDPDIRSAAPGKCPRCGMTLVPGIPEPAEYPLSVNFKPPNIPAGKPVTLEFRVFDPKTGAPVKAFEIVHERLFHMFLVSEDLHFFLHDHPELGPDGVFRFTTVLPKPGNYAVLADMYPAHGMPQLISKLFTTAGYAQGFEQSRARLPEDLSAKTGENLNIGLTLEPAKPIAGTKTMMFFHLTPSDGLEPYLGAWGHLLAASDDLIDLIHTHPSYVTTPDGERQVQFDLFFPREATYRVWVQFQRLGKVITAAFTIPVTKLK